MQVWRQLMTVRQQFVNSMQPFQTVYPFLGSRKFLSYARRYNTQEGRDILNRWGQLRPNGEWYEGREFRSGVVTGRFIAIQAGLKRILFENKYVSASAESRNQNFTFVAFYLYATEQLNMDPKTAAEHALLKVAQTQFSFTKANTPRVLRGPVSATLLQYKRFLLMSLSLAHNIRHSQNEKTGELEGGWKRANMLRRWLSTFLVMGGIKGLPVWFVIDFLAKIFFGDEKKTAWDIHAELRKQLGEGAADTAIMGIPAALGVDISGSIVLFPKPYGRTAYEQMGAFVAGPTLSMVGDAWTSVMNKDAVYQNGFVEIGKSLYGSSPAAQQIGNAIDLMSGVPEKYDAQSRLQFRRTVAEQVAGLFALRTVRESMETLEYNKITVMKEATDSMLDEIASKISGGDIVGAQQAVRGWNSMFPEVPLPTNLAKLMKNQSIARRVSRKKEDHTLTTRQRRLKGVNELMTEILIKREGMDPNMEEGGEDE
jgi:hypothetical protein